MALTRGEVKAVLAELDGDTWLVATLMYGAGLRLAERPRLRVLDRGGRGVRSPSAGL